MKKYAWVILATLCIAFGYSATGVVGVSEIDSRLKRCDPIPGCGGDNFCTEASYIDGCKIGCPAHPEGVIQCADVT